MSIWLLAILSLLAWSPSLRNGFVWDDRNLIVESRLVEASDGPARAFLQDFWASEEQVGTSDYYRPLVACSYWLDHRIYGLRPWGFHLTNLLIHAAAVVLLAALLRDLGLGSGWSALLAGAFAVHPTLAESVAWIAGRTDSLAALFVLLALWADARERRVLRATAFGLALLSKESAVVMPVLAIVLARARGQEGSFLRAMRKRWELGVALAAYFAARALVLGPPAGWIGAAELPWSTRVIALAHLPGTLLAPLLGRIEYGGALPPAALLPGAIVGALLFAMLVYSARGDRRIRGLALAGGIAYLPALPAILMKAVVADRLVYLPALFWVPSIGLLLARATSRSRSVVLLAVVVVVCLAASMAKSSQWRSDRTLFEAAARAPHASARVRLNLGIAYHDEGRLPEAFRELNAALALAPLKTGRYMLGLLFTEVGWDLPALAEYRKALAIDPGYLAAANNLGALLAERGEIEEARRVLHRAFEQAEHPPAELALNLARLDAEQVAPHPPPSDEPLEIQPALLSDARYLNRRALALLRARRLDQAKVLVLAAIAADPKLLAARLNLAQYEILAGAPERGRAMLEEILRADPSNEPARRLMERLSEGSRATH